MATPTEERRARSVELALDLMRANERARTTTSQASQFIPYGTSVTKGVSAADLIKDAKRIEQFLKGGS